MRIEKYKPIPKSKFKNFLDVYDIRSQEPSICESCFRKTIRLLMKGEKLI